MKIEQNRHLISSETTIREALEALNNLSGGEMTLFVVDSSGRALGSLTDGDIRRALIGGVPVTSPAGEAAYREFLALRPDTDEFTLLAEARRRNIYLMPRLDHENHILELLDVREVERRLPIDAVLMAGGRGERLRPLTDDCPKPLLPVGRKAIIDYNVDELLDRGVERIFVTVNYLKEQIIDHFRHPRFEGRVVCVEEPTRLGTIGSLSLVPGLGDKRILLMNSDLLTSLDFESLYLSHVNSEADLTMGAIPYNVSVPFSILNTEGDRVTEVVEKPTFNYFAGAGVYMMKPELVSEIAVGQYLDAPDFVSSLIRRGARVDYFPIEGTWLDIGSPDDYRHANKIMGSRQK